MDGRATLTTVLSRVVTNTAKTTAASVHHLRIGLGASICWLLRCGDLIANDSNSQFLVCPVCVSLSLGIHSPYDRIQPQGAQEAEDAAVALGDCPAPFQREGRRRHHRRGDLRGGRGVGLDLLPLLPEQG